MGYIEKYCLWCQNVTDPETEEALVSIQGDLPAIEDAFFVI